MKFFHWEIQVFRYFEADFDFSITAGSIDPYFWKQNQLQVDKDINLDQI